MNPAERKELEAIRAAQTEIHMLVDDLDRRVVALRRKLEVEAETAETSVAHSAPPPLPVPTPAVIVAPLEAVAKVEPVPLAIPSASPVGRGILTVTELPKVPEVLPAAKLPEVKAEPEFVPPPLASEGPKESIELRLGTYWLVRIGIVVLLTGLVFLGNYAYHQIVPMLGAGAKLSLLVLAGAVIAGLGAWVERSRETMRNYGRVLLAGGVAVIYYAAYAAHFVERLRVIESPLIGGALLLALAGGFIWFADRRRSEPLALMAVLLSYYTAAINPIGGFSLFSNLLLTAVAVFFLVRNRWATISFASLGATYASYGFWRFHGLEVQGASGVDGFGMALGFLAGYWLLFTVAVFLARPEAMRPAQRAAFLTANNGAFFAYATQHFMVHQPESFWIFALGYGVVLVGLAALAARRNPEERAVDGAYLAQGLALVTVGLAAKLSGPQLATVLAVESGVFITKSRDRHRWLYEIAAVLAALGAVELAVVGMHNRPELAWPLGGTVAALLIFDAWWLKHLRGELSALKISERALGFAVLGLGVFGGAIWKGIAPEWQPVALAGAALLCAVSILGLRLPEVALAGQAYLVAGVALFFYQDSPTPWLWNAVLLVGISLALTHWWEHQRVFRPLAELLALMQFASAGAALAVAGWELHARVPGPSWIVVAAALAFGSLIYGLATRTWSVAILGQFYCQIAVIAFIQGFFAPPGNRLFALAPIVNFAVTVLIASWAQSRRLLPVAEGFDVRAIARVYRIEALALLALWGFVYVDPAWRTVFFCLLGAAQIFAGSFWLNRERTMGGAIYAVLGMVLFVERFQAIVNVPELLAMLAVPVSLRLGRRLGDDTAVTPQVRNGLVALTLGCVWLWVTRLTFAHEGANGLTAVWALLALVVFAAGLLLRERVYRIGGFAILALAIGRVFLVDVWRLETLYRIVSFLVLGVVLLVLGYLYNRFADSIRRWL